MNLSCVINVISIMLILGIVTIKTYISVVYIINEYYLLIIGLVTIPILILFLIFPVVFTVSNIFLLLMPTSYWENDSEYFTYKIDGDCDDDVFDLQQLTIQIHIYDDDFKKVIRPTLMDCVAARNDYIRRGGKCNIIANDDGLFKILEDRLNNMEKQHEVVNRILYYKKYNIGFTSRKYPNRPGKFKKASNMNYGQSIHDKQTRQLYRYPLTPVKRLLTPTQNCISQDFDQKKEAIVIDFDEKIKIPRSPRADRSPLLSVSTPRYKPYIFNDIIVDAKNRYMYYGDIFIGNYILLVDSDTTIPSTIMPSIIKLFEKEPELGYVQHFTMPLKSSYQNYFSKMISFFTVNLYHVIFRICTRNGDISPLIGHNITLKRTALEKISKMNNGKFWRDDRVSEDFDLCLRMYQMGYKGRFVYDKDRSFGEGVSLSYKDEMIKYSKFAHGASEILFNPVKDWCNNGIITQSFKEFMKTSSVPLSSKVGILGYLMTYFSISSSILVTPIIAVMSCFVEHWELIMFDPLYAYLFLFSIYGVLNPLVNYKLKCQFERLDQHPPSILREFLCGLFFCLFYCSVSFPLFAGIVSHLFSINISWGSTVKSLFIILVFTVLFIIYFDMNKMMLVPLLSLSIGHIVVPFIMNTSLWCPKEYKFNITNTPPERVKTINLYI
jgi:hypothetical protein